MRAFTVNRYGKKETLSLIQVAEPTPKDSEVVVQVHASGVNLLDSKIRDGEFKLLLPYNPPLVLLRKLAQKQTNLRWAMRCTHAQPTFILVLLLNTSLSMSVI